MAVTMSDVRVNVYAASPQEIRSILLEDGWHDVAGECELIQFAIAERSSPPAPHRLYPALQFKDGKTGKRTITPLRNVLAFEPMR